MNRFGLIGFPLGHSYSKKYFTDLFDEIGVQATHVYELFEIRDIKDFPALLDKYPDLKGVNVTVPHKIKVCNFIDQLDESALKVGAVNVIKRCGEELIGYNSDLYGFKQSLVNWFGNERPYTLILGSGGASKAVQVALDELSIQYKIVSRQKNKGTLMYDQLHDGKELFTSFKLIVNTTPVGMSPNVHDVPPIPLAGLHQGQYVYDLIYNPEKTLLLSEAEKRGAKILNGLEMLKLQAGKSWDIWSN